MSERALLPYEHQLIDALGVSKEEYLAFVAAQHEYTDPKAGTVLDVRNAPVGTVALVLTVVGMIFQVAAALLAPSPSQQRQRGTPLTRDQQFAPRFGFNGTQEFAKYGDTVPLVYTNVNDNASGGVRVSTALLWGAVLSYGSSQFMQLMLSVGAARVRNIVPIRTAIGQLPLRDVTRSRAWLYYQDNGATTYANRYTDLTVQGRGVDASSDPTYRGGSQETATLFHDSGKRRGFSQVYSPSTGTVVGVTGIIPIQAAVIELTSKGKLDDPKKVPISIEGLAGWTGGDRRTLIGAGTRMVVKIEGTNNIKGDRRKNAKPSVESVKRAIREAASVFDEGSLYKLGGAIFRVESITYQSDGDIDRGAMSVAMVCETSGYTPAAPYSMKTGLSDADIKKANEDEDALLEAREEAVNERDSIPATSKNNQKKRNELDKRIAEIDAELEALKEARQEEKESKNLSTAQKQIGTKCLARIEQATYSTVTKCSAVEFALRVKAFRRLSGRAESYGEKSKDYGYKSSENGVQPRTLMYTIEYSRGDAEQPLGRVPYVFCFRNSAEQDVFVFLRFLVKQAQAGGRFASYHWKFRWTPVTEAQAEAGAGFRGYCFIRPSGKLQTVEAGGVSIQFNGGIYAFSEYPPFNEGPSDTTEWELFNLDSRSNTQFSYQQGPEVAITAVNEQSYDLWSAYGDRLYQGISTIALHAFSGRGFQDVRNITVWADEGKELRRLSPNWRAYNTSEEVAAFIDSEPSRSSSYAPDIFVDSVLDEENGIGQYARADGLDFPGLSKAKAYCEVNQLFMDGVIAQSGSWREFWAEAAPFSLLELGRVGGKDTLLPAVPANDTGQILSQAPLPISSLFNTGNILEGSYKEEYVDYGSNTQDVIVTAVYRDVERDGYFPRNNSVECRLAGVRDAVAIRETIDLSQFVTTRRQALLVSRFTCLVRNLSRKAYEWQTFPTDTFVAPGSYALLDVGMNAWDGIYSGRIMPGGALNVPLAAVLPNGEYNFLLYSGSEGTVRRNAVQVVNNVAAALAPLEGYLFVVGRPAHRSGKRTVKITQVDMDSEGLVTIQAVDHPVDDDGVSLLAKYLRDASRFDEL